MKLKILFGILVLSLAACTGEASPSPTSVIISRELATVFISPTPNEEEAAATRAVVTVTSIPPSATVIPTETPYVGIFVGEAEAEASFIEIVEPIFAPEAASAQGEPTANAGRCIVNP